MSDTITNAKNERHPLMERVELINHLLKFSDRLFVIMSPDAEELKAFTQMLTQEGTIALFFAQVSPDLALTADDVAADLARAWGIDVAFGESASQAIEQNLHKQLPGVRRAVAIVNEADRLPRGALNDLIAYMQRMDELTGGRVRLVLTGGPALSHHIQELKSVGEGGQVYALHLSGTAGSPAAQSPTMRSGAVNNDPLMGPEDSISAILERNGLPPRVLLIGGGAVSLALAVIVALMLRPAEFKEDQISLPLFPEKRMDAPALPIPLPAQSMAPTMEETALAPSPYAPVSGHQLLESAPARPMPEPVRTETPPPAPAKAPPPAPAPAKAPPPAPAPAKAPPPPPAPAKAPPPPPAPVKAPPTPTKVAAAALPTVEADVDATVAAAAKAAVETEAGTAPIMAGKEPHKPSAPSDAKKNGGWYAAQPDHRYVVQVISMNTAKDIDGFIRKHGLKDCHSFVQKRNGQTLNTLTCGLYESRDAAAKAASALPEKVRASSPYPRRVDDIRKIMMP